MTCWLSEVEVECDEVEQSEEPDSDQVEPTDPAEHKGIM